MIGRKKKRRAKDLRRVIGPPEHYGPPRGVPLLEVRADQCRAIVGRWEGFVLYCGNPTVGTTSWCSEHLKIYWGR